MIGKIALVTGATSGIGEATARLFAQKGLRVIICGRRKERLKELEAELSKITEVYTLSFDVSQQKEVAESLNSLPNEWKSIDILVNNAGNAHGLEPIQAGRLSDWEAMIDINLKGLLYVTQCILPQMVERETGHIVNIGSIAGKEAYPNGNVYCASKAAVDSLTKGMRIDLNPYGIRVTQIAPGLVETEFSLVRFKGDAQRAKKVYEGYQPLSAQDIADAIWYAVAAPAHVQIADIVIFPTAQASATIVKKKT
ncbi:SDR family oxidoreductase [Raineya orbicola]|jgi:NADP-dependent 3-hydroxy acid dehydrogenase YdfG|uniref:Short-chain alcohol dehydrogenase n=1 Tax=Raineya orbicola TaxID=2016530 RepID=A0A2N3IHG8_9BACT|nr:SDR family oxidoreductase [Raineya orbicola]PKQ69746.1 Short-chain alcohol dehydrogenase [Raineya orbicola]